MEMWLFLKNTSAVLVSMLVDEHINLKASKEHAVQPYMTAQQRIKKSVHEHGSKNRPHTLLWLSKVYSILAGMYACQVWEKALVLLETFSRREEYCHKLASAERVWAGAFAVQTAEGLDGRGCP
eukprot:1156208-Pelagomonas_calceolata.AAC.6